MVVLRTAALFELHEQADFKPARAVILVNRPRWGKGKRMEGHLAHALVARFGSENVVVVSTDSSGEMPEGKLPDGVRYVDFAKIADRLVGDRRQRLLVEFLRSLKPEFVFNINSRLMWDSYGPYGKALSASMKLFGCFLCNEQTIYGHWTGYPLNRFYRSIDVLQAVFTDSHKLADDIIMRHQIPTEQRQKVQVLSAPMNATIELVSAPEINISRRPQVFWAGRFDPQKRIDLVYAIAKLMPQVDFRMWGEPVLGHMGGLPEQPKNITQEGVYDAFSDLPLHEADLWLYTSGWDGVPQMLLEVAMTGVPMVGSLVGGTGEVLRETLARGVAATDDPTAYVMEIEAILADPATARIGANTLRETLIRERTEAQFAAQLDTILAL